MTWAASTNKNLAIQLEKSEKNIERKKERKNRLWIKEREKNAHSPVDKNTKSKKVAAISPVRRSPVQQKWVK